MTSVSVADLQPVFQLDNFLDASELDHIRSTLDGTPSALAEIHYQGDGASGADASDRNSDEFEADETLCQFVLDRLSAKVEKICDHLDIRVTRLRPPRFLKYREGQFFLRHPDMRPDPHYPQIVRDRRLTAIVFLNDQVDMAGPNGFTGGDLVLYPTGPDGERRHVIKPKAGTLVAFPATLEHEVTLVTSGTRLTVAIWMLV